MTQKPLIVVDMLKSASFIQWGACSANSLFLGEVDLSIITLGPAFRVLGVDEYGD